MQADLVNAFRAELYRAFKKLGADVGLLSIIGSYGDTLDDKEILHLLQDYNIDGKSLHGERPIGPDDFRDIIDGAG